MKNFTDTIREEEFKIVFNRLNIETSNFHTLDFGAGDGSQLKMLLEISKSAIGVDIENSYFKNNRESNIIEYDGKVLPFQDKSFDIIFSSNTFEHVENLDEIEKEFSRVLKPNGICVIILPSHFWKIWTFITYYFQIPIILYKFFKRKFTGKKKKSQGNNSVNRNNEVCNKKPLNKFTSFLFPEKHGVRGNYFTEFYYFHPKWWLKHFRKNNFLIKDYFALKILYTGNNIFSRKISVSKRKKLAKLFGSSCYAYILKFNN